MAKRVLIVSFAILALAMANQIGVKRAHGQANQFRMLNDLYALVGNKVYYLDGFNAPVGWRELPWASQTLPPVPTTSLVAYSNGFAVTDSGEGWQRQAGVWVSLGFLPGVTSIENTSWGQVKARYHR